MVQIGELISSKSQNHSGYGAGPGTVDTYVFACPCGKGTYTKVRDNIPGFKDSDYSLDCEECRANYNFDLISGEITEKA